MVTIATRLTLNRSGDEPAQRPILVCAAGDANGAQRHVRGSRHCDEVCSRPVAPTLVGPVAREALRIVIDHSIVLLSTLPIRPVTTSKP